MTTKNAHGLNLIRMALVLAALPSAHAGVIRAEQTNNGAGPAESWASMQQRIGLSRPGIGAGPFRSGIGLRRLPNDPSLCGSRQGHLFVNRPCVARNTGDNGQPDDNDAPGNNNPTDGTGNHNNGGGPLNISGASPYNVDNHRPSGDDRPNHSSDAFVAKAPDVFVPAPEPGYAGVAGLALVGIWMLARKRRPA